LAGRIAGPLTDRGKRPCAGQHRSYGHGQHRAQWMPCSIPMRLTHSTIANETSQHYAEALDLHRPTPPLRRHRRPSMLGDMTILRMDNVLIVVDDLDAVISFFVELGMELEGKGPIEGRWVERVIGIDDVRQDVAMLRTPDGHGRIELAMFHTPKAISAEPKDAPANTLGIRRIMFAVDDIEDVLARLRAHGAELVGELEQYEDSYRLCYVRGPEGIIVALAEPLS
jgi:catechol 2,3-dioxygenase-like lactoylglutathione lyase family enzyme